MSKLDSLIAQLCPDGVEYVPLSELFDLRNGYTPSKANAAYWQNGTIPWFRMEDIRANGRVLSDAIQHISASALKGKGVFPANSIIVATSATIGVHALILCEALTNQRFVSLYPKAKYENRVDIRFMFYYFDIVDEWCKNNLNEGNFASVDMSKFAKFKIPLPPLVVQREIVDILNNFTELTAELTAGLTAELTARKKQYEYYRNELLTFGGSVPMVTLGDVSSIYDGTHQTPTYTSEGVRFVSVENINELKQSKKCISAEDYKRLYKVKPQKNDVFMTRIGSIGACAVVEDDEPLAYYVTLTLIRPNQERINSRFLKHAIESIHGKNELLKRTLIHATPIKINLGEIGKISIPLPSLEEQAHIVAILDRFDKLCKDISEGLPAEIDARYKQYEYYHDRLLTFKEAGA